MAIAFEGRELSAEEEYQILDTISRNTSIHVVCVIDNNIEYEEYAREQVRGLLHRTLKIPENFTKGR